jgi:AcrR family transcriptional regulator
MGGMAVEKWTPERRRQRTRDAVLDAAADVFAKRGFHAASLDEIAETAGYTRGAIYKHFSDKEDLLHEVCVRLNERAFAEFDELPNTDTDVDEIAAHWRSMVERDADFQIVMLEFQLHALRNPGLRERALEFRRANAAALADYIAQRAADTGERLPLPAEDLAAVLAITSEGFAHAALFEPDTARLYAAFLQLLIRGMQSAQAT